MVIQDNSSGDYSLPLEGRQGTRQLWSHVSLEAPFIQSRPGNRALGQEPGMQNPLPPQLARSHILKIIDPFTAVPPVFGRKHHHSSLFCMVYLSLTTVRPLGFFLPRSLTRVMIKPTSLITNVCVFHPTPSIQELLMPEAGQEFFKTWLRTSQQATLNEPGLPGGHRLPTACWFVTGPQTLVVSQTLAQLTPRWKHLSGHKTHHVDSTT